jgi:hypothetical protein
MDVYAVSQTRFVNFQIIVESLDTAVCAAYNQDAANASQVMNESHQAHR